MVQLSIRKSITCPSPQGQSGSGAGYPERLCCLHPQKFSRPEGIRPQAIQSSPVAGPALSKRWGCRLPEDLSNLNCSVNQFFFKGCICSWGWSKDRNLCVRTLKFLGHFCDYFCFVLLHTDLYRTTGTLALCLWFALSGATGWMAGKSMTITAVQEQLVELF